MPVKVGFRASCPHCSSDLHACIGCRYYAVGKPNDCIVPGTEFIKDREAANFCEEFKPSIPPSPSCSSQGKSNPLGTPAQKKDFHSLFKDDIRPLA
ncbi:MAG: hypothetical protein HY861_04490 [Chlamydiia bacterium]|nr:hypothetical protein [Chlamydiia bacterium]